MKVRNEWKEVFRRNLHESRNLYMFVLIKTLFKHFSGKEQSASYTVLVFQKCLVHHQKIPQLIHSHRHIRELSTILLGGGVEMFHDGKTFHAPSPWMCRKFPQPHLEHMKTFPTPIVWSCHNIDAHLFERSKRSIKYQHWTHLRFDLEK